MENLTLDTTARIKRSLKPFVYLWAKQIGYTNKYEKVFSPNFSGVHSKIHDVIETTGNGPDEDVGDTTLPIGNPTPA